MGLKAKLQETLDMINTYFTPENIKPSIQVSPSNGLITATSLGESSTQQLTTKSGTTITPGTSNQTVISAGKYTTGDIIVTGDADLVANNIVYNKNIFGVTGNTWAGSLTFTSNNYTSSNYYTSSGSKLIVDKETGYGFVIIQGGT